jgi:hypothetical protein
MPVIGSVVPVVLNPAARFGADSAVNGGSTEDLPVPYYLIAAIVALVAAVIVSAWTTLQAVQRGKRYRKLIRRELEEIGPDLKESEIGPNLKEPWWEFATRRTVHEEIFRREHISENRDFILSLNPDVVYQVSQLWLALEKRDGKNWVYFLGKLANNRKVTSPDLKRAHENWAKVMDNQHPKFRNTMGVPTPFRQSAALNRTAELFRARLTAYGKLLPLLNHRRIIAGYGSRAVAKEMTEWFYENGNGLLLSGRAHEQFRQTRSVLEATYSRYKDVEDSLSALRTDLKIDLGVRQPQERRVEMAWPEDERW